MRDKLIIPYRECFELEQMKEKRESVGYQNFTRQEMIRWEELRKKEKYAEEVGRAWIEESTGITVWTRPTVGYLIKKFFRIDTKKEARWR